MICKACRAALRIRHLPLHSTTTTITTLPLRPSPSTSTTVSQSASITPSMAFFSSSTKRAAKSKPPGTRKKRSLLNPDGTFRTTGGEFAIAQLLIEHFDPTELIVNDVSGTLGEYHIDIASYDFRDATPEEQQRLVKAALTERLYDFKGLYIRTKYPGRNSQWHAPRKTSDGKKLDQVAVAKERKPR